MPERPLIWVLKGLRGGDTAQAMELALQLGGKVEGKQLHFNMLHAVPNVLAGARVTHLTTASRHLLRPPWPDLVVATGRRTAPVAVWIKQHSGGHSKLVQIGRPRMALSAFDLVVTTPQYGTPSAMNVIEIPVPFASPQKVPDFECEAFLKEWSHLPRPWILGVIGGGKFPVRLTAAELARFGSALQSRAKVTGGSVILLDSPRSPGGAVDMTSRPITVPKWVFHRGHSSNPYQAALALCDELVVTSDSVSMVTEMLMTGKPTSIFRLPVSKLLPRWSAEKGVMAALARNGLLHSPRDVNGLMNGLLAEGYIGDLAQLLQPRRTYHGTQAHTDVVSRVRTLLGSSVLPSAD